MSIRTPSASALGRLAIAALLAACSPAAPAQPQATTPAPTTAAVATPAATKPPTIPRIAVPATLRGDWLAEAPTIEGVGPHDPLIQASFDWDAGIDFWVQIDGNQVAMSHSGPSPMDQIHLVSKDSTTGCKLGDEGRYGWTRSADGLFLDIRLIQDACAYRSAILARTWVHALQAVNDGGLGIMRAGSAILGTLPDYRWAASGADGVTDLHTFDHDAPEMTLLIIDGASGLDAPCSPARKRVSLVANSTGLIAYLDGLPGVSLAKESMTVDGNPAVRLTLTSDATIDCPSGEIAMLRGADGAPDPEYSFPPGGTHSAWVVQLPDRALLFWFEGFDSAAQEALMDSLHFIDSLPTP